jgi:methyl-accepting chemotaxis protein
VAYELRKLSEKTANSTSEIGAMVKTIQQDVYGAVDLMQDVKRKVEREVGFSTQAGESLHAIVKSVADLSSMVQQIAAATEEMSTVSESISGDIQSIAASSSEMKGESGNIAQESSDLAGLAGKLEEMVGRFRL